MSPYPKGYSVIESKIDTSVAETYESVLVAAFLKPWAEGIVAQIGLTPGMSVLDVACGTGIGARSAARLIGSPGGVIGVDCDAGMIEIARSATLKERMNVEYRVGLASDLPVESSSFDVALCFHGFPYFPDRPKAMVELHRVLKPDAKLVVAVWGPLESCKGQWALVKALERRGIDASAARHPYLLAEQDVMRTLAESAGFRQVAIRAEQRLAHFDSAESFVNAMAQGAPSTRLALAKVAAIDWPSFLSEVEIELAPWRQDAAVAFPMECNILEARRNSI
jgi:SAM-dependent methyltransferase